MEEPAKPKKKITGAPPPPRMPPPSGSFRGKLPAPKGPPPSISDERKASSVSNEENLTASQKWRLRRMDTSGSIGNNETTNRAADAKEGEDYVPRSARGARRDSPNNHDGDYGDEEPSKTASGKPAPKATSNQYRSSHSRDERDGDDDYHSYRRSASQNDRGGRDPEDSHYYGRSYSGHRHGDYDEGGRGDYDRDGDRASSKGKDDRYNSGNYYHNEHEDSRYTRGASSTRDDDYYYEDYHYDRSRGYERGNSLRDREPEPDRDQGRAYRGGSGRDHYDDEDYYHHDGAKPTSYRDRGESGHSGRDHDYRSGPKDDYYRDDDVNQQRQYEDYGRSSSGHEDNTRSYSGRRSQSGQDDEDPKVQRMESKLTPQNSAEEGSATGSSATPGKLEKAPSEKKKKKKKKQPSEEKNEGGVTQANRATLGLNPSVFDTRTISTVLTELMAFLTQPFQREPGVVIRCFIERDRGLANALSPVYTLYSDQEDGSGRMLMAARKIVKSATPYYVLSTNVDDLYKPRSDRSSQYLGKLRGNSNATEYILYDHGDSPEEIIESMEAVEESDSEAVDFQSGKNETTNLRKELAVIWYNYGINKEHERKVEVAIPKVTTPSDENEPCQWEFWQPTSPRGSLSEAFKRVRFQGGQNAMDSNRILIFHQKETRYDPLSSCLVDFKGRATAASVKNFQLMKSFPEDNDQRKIYYSEKGEGRYEDEKNSDGPVPILLQMGKVGRDCFNMDLQHPFSLLQAFAICISRFDTKSKWS